LTGPRDRRQTVGGDGESLRHCIEVVAQDSRQLRPPDVFRLGQRYDGKQGRQGHGFGRPLPLVDRLRVDLQDLGHLNDRAEAWHPVQLLLEIEQGVDPLLRGHGLRVLCSDHLERVLVLR
jgi:hypothetical protein